MGTWESSLRRKWAPQQLGTRALSKWISPAAPTGVPLRLVLGLMVSSIDVLDIKHLHTNCIGVDLLAETLGPFGYVPLLDSIQQKRPSAPT